MSKTKLSDHRCECRQNCGRFTPFATHTDKRRGHVKGQPLPCIPGHNRAGGSGAITERVPVEMDELRIRELRSVPDAQAAQVLDERMRHLEGQYKRNFVERGFICIEMEERELWKHLINPETSEAYTSFERWVVTAATHSRSDCFEAMRAVRELRDVPREQLMAIPRKNLGIMRQLSTKVRKHPDTIKAAQTASRKEFIAHVQENHPDQHVEAEVPMKTNPTKTQAEIINEGLAAAAWIWGLTSREACLEAMANYLLDSDCEKEGYEELTVRRALETARTRGEAPKE